MNYLRAGGENHPFRFSWRALKKLAAKLGLKKVAELDQALTGLEFEHIPTLIHIGIEEGYRMEGKECPVTTDTVEDWLDEDFGLMMRAMEAVGEQMQSATEKKVTAAKQAK